jgi:hypothetical protein
MRDSAAVPGICEVACFGASVCDIAGTPLGSLPTRQAAVGKIEYRLDDPGFREPSFRLASDAVLQLSKKPFDMLFFLPNRGKQS